MERNDLNQLYNIAEPQFCFEHEKKNSVCSINRRFLYFNSNYNHCAVNNSGIKFLLQISCVAQ